MAHVLASFQPRSLTVLYKYSHACIQRPQTVNPRIHSTLQWVVRFDPSFTCLSHLLISLSHLTFFLVWNLLWISTLSECSPADCIVFFPLCIIFFITSLQTPLCLPRIIYHICVRNSRLRLYCKNNFLNQYFCLVFQENNI